jgi:hypothetical protein
LDGLSLLLVQFRTKTTGVSWYCACPAHHRCSQFHRRENDSADQKLAILAQSGLAHFFLVIFFLYLRCNH